MSTKNSKVQTSKTITLELHREHKNVVQFREADQDNATITGGVYLPKAYVGKAKKLEVTVKHTS